MSFFEEDDNDYYDDDRFYREYSGGAYGDDDDDYDDDDDFGGSYSTGSSGSRHYSGGTGKEGKIDFKSFLIIITILSVVGSVLAFINEIIATIIVILLAKFLFSYF